MKKIKILFGLSVVLLMAACTKKTTITEEYNPPQATLFGTWKLMSENVNNGENYYVFANDGSNFAYYLMKDVNGFKSKDVYAFKATDKQINVNYALYNYSVVADTLILYESPSTYNKYLRVVNPTMTPSNWTNSLKAIRRIELPRAVSYGTIRPFGIDGDNLYLCGYNGSGYYVYKYNSLTNQHLDSISVPSVATTYYKSPSVYYGFDANNKIYKTTGLVGPTIAVSLNDINYTYALSMNPSSGVFFAFSNNSSLLSGTDGSNFNTLFSFSNYGVNYVLYDKNDEFMGLRNGSIVRMKISPSFSVVNSYDRLPGFYTYAYSSNGTDTWLFGYNNQTSTYQLVKVNLN